MQRIIYACKYGNWYYENKEYFDQFLNLRQGKLTIDEYSDEFSSLQAQCALDEDNGHYVTIFTRGLRPSEAFWEAICVERLIKRYRLRKAKMQEEKSLQTTKVSVAEPRMENASSEFEEKEPESHHSDSVVQVVHVE